MAAVVRQLEHDEAAAFVRSTSIPFLEPRFDPTELEELTAQVAPGLEAGRTWVVDDEGAIVGNAAVFTRTLTLPGAPGEACPEVAFAAVSEVGVHPTHRRQGLLRKLMGAMLDDARQRSEPVAGLLSSQSSIYGRFGFGWAASTATYAIDSARSAFLHPAPPLHVRLVGGPDATATVPATFDAARLRRAGQIDRPSHVWDRIIADRADDRHGRSAMTWIVADGGVAGYRIEEVREGGRRYARAHVEDLAGQTPEIEAGLWRFLLDLDLVEELQVRSRPVDEPVRHRLADPRQLRTQAVGDFLWLRVLDTAAALTARRYPVAGRLVLDVAAPATTPDDSGCDTGADPAAGRWVLEADQTGASVKPAGGESADLTLGLDDLGSLLAGGVRATTLVAAGRIREDRPGASIDADTLFRAVPDPLCSTSF